MDGLPADRQDEKPASLFVATPAVQAATVQEATVETILRDAGDPKLFPPKQGLDGQHCTQSNREVTKGGHLLCS